MIYAGRRLQATGMGEDAKRNQAHQHAIVDLRARLAQVDEALAAWARWIADQRLPPEQRCIPHPPDVSLERLNRVRALMAEELERVDPK
jgi:hypothetical protein